MATREFRIGFTGTAGNKRKLTALLVKNILGALGFNVAKAPDLLLASDDLVITVTDADEQKMAEMTTMQIEVKPGMQPPKVRAWLGK